LRRRCLHLLICSSVVLCTVVSPVAAAERIGSITVYSADEVARLAVSGGGSVYLEIPGARQYELLENPADWFPMPVEAVVAAIEETAYPVCELHIDVIILHVPRSEVKESSTEGSVVFLTPGRVPYPEEHVHYTTVHELGHALHNAFMPDSRTSLWREYARIRGIELNLGRRDVPHAWRTHEIFAEDFRALFGGDMARLDGRVENHDIPPPSEVEGLEEFFLSLRGRGAPAVSVLVSPNPSAGQVSIKAILDGQVACPERISVYDARGRLVRHLGSGSDRDGTVVWDGRDLRGSPAAPGVYLLTLKIEGLCFSRKIIRVTR